MNFGEAIQALKAGLLVTREGWNGRGMYLYLVSGSEFVVNREPLNRILGEGTLVHYRPHIDMHTAQGENVPWVASQSDILAEDWSVVQGE